MTGLNEFSYSRTTDIHERFFATAHPCLARHLILEKIAISYPCKKLQKGATPHLSSSREYKQKPRGGHRFFGFHGIRLVLFDS
jgi:hypothetical protein